MAHARKPGADGMRTGSRAELRVPQVSARQEILTSLVSALDSVENSDFASSKNRCTAMSKLNAEVACVTVHEDSVIAVGTEKGRVFLNSRKEIQSDFQKFCRVPCLQTPTAVNAHTKAQDGDAGKTSKDTGHVVQWPSAESHSNVFVLRKMVEEVFSVLYSEAVGKSSLVPVPYDWISKELGSVIVHGLPDGVSLRKPSEYDTKTLMKILEQSNRIRFTVKRPPEEPLREAKTCVELNHNSSSTKSHANHTVLKPGGQEASTSGSVLSSFLYGMPTPSQTHVDGKLELKPTSLHSLAKERPGAWAPVAEKVTPAKDCADNGDRLGVPGDVGQSPPGLHVSKRLLFSIVHEKSGKHQLNE